MFTVSRIYFNPYFTVGLQYQATWRALCLGLRIRHVSRGEGESFVPQNPLIFRDRVPSLWGWLPPVLRPACLRFSRSAYLRFLLRPVCLQCFWGQSRLRCVFKAHVPSVRVFLFATQELVSSYSNTYVYLYNTNSHSSKKSGTLLLLQLFITVYCCIIITTTLLIVTLYLLHSCVYNNNSRSYLLIT